MVDRAVGSSSTMALIKSSTAAAYKLTAADAGHQVALLVTATDKEGQGASAGTAPAGPVLLTPPAPLAAPLVSGTAQVGQVVSVSKGTWSTLSSLAYHYQWESCDSTGILCAPIAGATAHTYTVADPDVGDLLAATVTVTDSQGQSASDASSNVVGPVAGPAPPSVSAAPVLTGDATDGQTLSVSEGVWTSPDVLAYAYQWQRCDGLGAHCVNIPGATSSTYAVS